METVQKIKKNRQQLLKLERNLTLQKLKLRRSDTRKKIEFGDLIIKSNMCQFSDPIILGSLIDTFERIKKNNKLEKLFQLKGKKIK